MSYADAVTREAAWFNSAVAGLPALALAAGGVFDIVGAYPRRISQRPRQLYLWRSEVVDQRTALNGQREWRHSMVAELVWAQLLPLSESDDELGRLDAALDAVVERIRGDGDVTHGGRFFDQPGPVRVIYGDVMMGLSAIDAVTSAGQAWVVRVTYTLTETFVA